MALFLDLESRVRILGIVLLSFVLVGCQIWNPKPDPKLAGQATPEQLSQGKRGLAGGESLTWGGKVQSVRNLARVTRVEIVSYPVGEQGKPLTGEPASGRFIVEMDGFLEPNELSRGTPVTVRGEYVRVLDGKVGEAAYRRPLLMGEKLDVWPRREVAAEPDRPDVRWSIGVGSGGSHGVGVGIAF